MINEKWIGMPNGISFPSLNNNSQSTKSNSMQPLEVSLRPKFITCLSCKSETVWHITFECLSWKISKDGHPLHADDSALHPRRVMNGEHSRAMRWHRQWWDIVGPAIEIQSSALEMSEAYVCLCREVYRFQLVPLARLDQVHFWIRCIR